MFEQETRFIPEKLYALHGPTYGGIDGSEIQIELTQEYSRLRRILKSDGVGAVLDEIIVAVRSIITHEDHIGLASALIISMGLSDILIEARKRQKSTGISNDTMKLIEVRVKQKVYAVLESLK